MNSSTTWIKIETSPSFQDLLPEDIKIDASLQLVPKLLASSVLLILVLMAWKLYGLILDYLDRKPLGEQSQMDTFHRLMFNHIRLMGVAGFINITVRRIFVDTGNIIAKIWMWPLFDITTVTALTIGLNPLIQLVLAQNLQIPLSDKWIYRGTILLFWLPFGIMNIICSSAGLDPPSYNRLRGQEIQHPSFNIFRLTIFSLCLALFLLSKLIIYCKSRSSRASSRHLLNVKVVTTAFFAFMFTLVSIQLGIAPYMAEINVMVGNLVPLAIIATNEKLLDSIEQRQPFLHRTLARMKKISCRRSHARIGPTNNIEMNSTQPGRP